MSLAVRYDTARLGPYHDGAGSAVRHVPDQPGARAGRRQANDEDRNPRVDDLPILAGEYDCIIVGAGTAGCVLANRLTQDSRTRVPVLAAGS